LLVSSDLPESAARAFPREIWSGGQTGADRAALDWAIARGIPHGGWCPRGRRAEDGRLPARYRLRETPGFEYAQRTIWNVRDSDGTVIFSLAAELTGGSQFTAEAAREWGRPCLHLPARLGEEEAVRRLRRFLETHRLQRLNVAGPRASNEPLVGAWVQKVLSGAWRARERK
jgi:hypothetical protein